MILKPGYDKKLIQFWRPLPYFQGRIRKKPNLGQTLIKMHIIFRVDQRIFTKIWIQLISGHDKR